MTGVPPPCQQTDARRAAARSPPTAKTRQGRAKAAEEPTKTATHGRSTNVAPRQDRQGRPTPPAEPARRGPGRPKVTELPDPKTGLTRRQQAILDVIRDSIERRGYPPSIREICESAGLASTSSVAHQLAMLERKGFLRRDPNRPRAVDMRMGSDGERPKAVRRARRGHRRRPAR